MDKMQIPRLAQEEGSQQETSMTLMPQNKPKITHPITYSSCFQKTTRKADFVSNRDKKISSWKGLAKSKLSCKFVA